MNATIRYIIPLLTTGIFISCSQPNVENEEAPLIPVHYKDQQYHIQLGQHIDSSRNYIDWTWDAENDPDGLKDSTGQDTYMSLNEPLIRFNNTQWLPALFVSTEKNKISNFTCSMTLQMENDESIQRDFLELIAADIPLLSNEAVIKDILQNKKYIQQTENSIEEIELQLNEGSKYDRFTYKVEFK